MTPLLSKAIDLLRQKVNLLIIDDDVVIRDSLVGLFSSPLFRTVPASSLDKALQAIGPASTGWHCWIVDIDLGQGTSGLSLLKRFPQFHYAIVLSGLRSMTQASEATTLGARAIIDKDPSALQLLYDEVRKTAALGFVLGGKQTPDLDTFLLLQDPSIDSIDEWAARAGITLRKLFRICEAHPPLTPFYALALYRTIHYLLGESGNPGIPITSGDAHRISVGEQEAYESWIEYTLLNHKG
jgi:CheY-like chemotaxis protein